MNKTEKKALNWLLGKKISKDDIHYQARQNPDFILADGRWFEAKRVVGHTVYFGMEQFYELKCNEEKTTILVFNDESEDPVVLSMKELEPGKIVREIHVVTGGPMVNVSLPNDEFEWLSEMVRTSKFGSISHGIRRCVGIAMSDPEVKAKL